MMAMEGEDYSSLAAIRATGGVAPDATWETNRRCAGANARLARALGIPLVTFHAGFLPERRGDPARSRMLERLREVVDRFADEGVATAFETGQESAATLADVLEELDRPGAGVNFDPANMLLYDMGEPVEALARLAPWVRQIHVKDAVRTRVPGTWGEEVPAGAGEVDWAAFFEQVQGLPEAVDLVIEREAGEGRLSDVRTAAELVRGHVGGPARGEEERD
jgi:sugar phosphate isomerase/epimerase